MNPIKRLVLSGGGSKGLAVLGALHYIYEQKGLQDITDYWATSVGSVISLLLLIGMTPMEIFHEFFIMESFVNSSELNISSIIDDGAFCPIHIFGNKIKTIISKKLGENSDPTFRDLHNRYNSKKLYIIGANTTKMCCECFSVDTHPEMKIIDAVEISCDLPYIFTKKKYNGCEYVDGGFINNYPINLADNGVDECLGICVTASTTNIKTAEKDYLGWIYRLLYLPVMELHRERISRISEKVMHIELVVNNISMFEMNPDNHKKINLFAEGYKQCGQKWTELNLQRKKRSEKLGYTISEHEQALKNLQECIDWNCDF